MLFYSTVNHEHLGRKNQREVLIVISSGNDLLTGWPQNDGMFPLSSIAVSVIKKWGVCLYHSHVGQIFQSHKIFRLT